MICFDSISFRYPGSPRQLLDGITAHVEEGQLCLVTGPTGSGKSTLLKCVNNLVPRFSGGTRAGRIRLAGIDTTEMLPRELARVTGYAGQDPLAGFVTETVEEELAYSMEQLGFPPAQMRRRVEETLDLLGIAELRGRSLNTLSGGQQQRVAIGSVLAVSPRILVLDEPTSALDPVAAEEVLAILSRLVHDVGTTVMIAEHRLERVVEYSDSMLLLGQRTMLGPPREVLASSPVQPPLAELAVRMGWEPLPLSIREGRRFTAEQRRTWASAPPRLPAPRPAGDAIVTARGVVVRYGRRVAVSDVDLDLHAGQVTGLMGRNGCGKSSLLWALHGAGPREAGIVNRSARLALVPQTPSDLLSLPSVEAECAAGDEAHALAPGTTLELLHRLAPEIRPTSHPRDLSAGQQVCLVLAVELAGGPRGVLLDEPTRGLDYAAKASLGDVVDALVAEDCAVLIATHDVELVASCCDRVVVMAEGEVVAEGPTRQVLPGSALLAPQVNKLTQPVALLTVEEYSDACM